MATTPNAKTLKTKKTKEFFPKDLAEDLLQIMINERCRNSSENEEIKRIQFLIDSLELHKTWLESEKKKTTK